MEKLTKLDWVICPECGYRYYVGTPLIMAEGIPAICTKCRHEFDPKDHLESRFKMALATWV